jgi:hypothetical protein
MAIIDMGENLAKLDSILNEMGLSRDLTAISEVKVFIVGVGGEEIKLTITLAQEVIIDSFEGCISAQKLSAILAKLDSEIKKLNLL